MLLLNKHDMLSKVDFVVVVVSAGDGQSIPVVQCVHLGGQLCRVVWLRVQLAGGVLQTPGNISCIHVSGCSHQHFSKRPSHVHIGNEKVLF